MGLGVIFVGISTTVGAINFLVTALKMRAPGMSLRRMPVFVWSIVGMALMVLFAVPALTVAAALNEADRLFGTQVYVPGAGGDTLLYQHLFWFWGHPEVYILFLPATGMISSIIPAAARRPLAGGCGSSRRRWRSPSSASACGCTTCSPPAARQALGYFSAASYIIAIPSGVQFFCWIATIWGGKVRFHTPMLFSIGFLVIFLLGGITGVMAATMPFDWQAHDTYFIVGPLPLRAERAVVFPIFGALYHWVPKMTGRMLSESGSGAGASG
ncbi:MAG: cbb3-type cytochrome c oxidase subunit I [Acidimicrobiales bacterium]